MCHVSRVMCHVSCVTCPIQKVHIKKFASILKEHTKIHQMNTRLETHQFEIDHTNTKCLRKSAGIQMQVTL